MSRLAGLGLAALAGCTLEPFTETERESKAERANLHCPVATSYAFESHAWGAPGRPDVMICSPDATQKAAFEIVCRDGETARLAAMPAGLACGPNVATAANRDRRECVEAQVQRAVEVRAACTNWWGETVYRAAVPSP
jgi:hypothetical protein